MIQGLPPATVSAGTGSREAATEATLERIGGGDLEAGRAALALEFSRARIKASAFLAHTLRGSGGLDLPIVVDRDAYLGEAVLAVWNAALTFAPERGAAFPTWCSQTVTYALRTELRRQCPISKWQLWKGTEVSPEEKSFRAPRLYELAAPEGSEPIHPSPSRAESPVDSYEREELQERVREALADLPGLERDVVTLRYLGERTWEQVRGELPGVRQGELKGALESGLSRLREALEEER